MPVGTTGSNVLGQVSHRIISRHVRAALQRASPGIDRITERSLCVGWQRASCRISSGLVVGGGLPICVVPELIDGPDGPGPPRG